MAYIHGIHGREIPTSLVPMNQISAGLPVVFGVAPIHLVTSEVDNVNKPLLCYSYADAVKKLGYTSKNWSEFTIAEAMYSTFALFNVAPAVFVNVLDPSIHKRNIALTEKTIANGEVILDGYIMINTLDVRVTEAGDKLVKDVDFTAAYNDNEELVITVLEDSTPLKDATKVFIGYDELDPSLVTKDEIIGGVDAETGHYEGLELINEVFPRFGLIPGTIIAPGFSHESDVAAVMKSKVTNINGCFKAFAIVDLDTNTVKKYSDVKATKDLNNLNDTSLAVCWPMVKLSDKKYHLSTQMAGLMCAVDYKNDDKPYKSPSNESLQADGACLADGTEIFLGNEVASYLNGQGVITAINFIGGWKLWGNRTSAYPANTDVKDAFVPIRRMFNWILNTLITTFWSKIDDPGNKRLISVILNSANLWFNSLTSQGVILGGRVEFRDDENSTLDLMDGVFKFHVYVTPPSPAHEIEFLEEYDVNYTSNLFSN